VGLAAEPDPATAVRLWSAVARDARRQGEVVEAGHALRRALEQVRAAGVARFEAVVSTNLANLHRSTGHLVEAARLYHQARAAALRLGEVRIEAAALHNLAGLRLEQHAVGEAIGLAREALRVARHGGEVAVLAHVAHTLGHLLHHVGAHDEAEASYLEAIGLLRRVDPSFACSAEGDLGALLADRGLVDAAARTLDQVERELAPDPVLRAILELHRAHLDAARARAAGSGEEAERWRATARARIAAARGVGGPRCGSAASLAERVVEGR
ncbi:MAG: tetratricopeptide repeat protein, partial [Myxococcota bacterium]